MSNAKTFVFNLEWYEVLEEYPVEVRLEVYDAIMRYAQSGTLIELKPLAKMAFSFIKKEMDYNRQRYETTVEKRREAGQKGGKRKQMQANEANACVAKQNKQMQANEANACVAKQNKQMLANEANACDAKQNKQMQTNQADNVNDNVNVNDNDKYFVVADTHTREEFEEEFFSTARRATVEALCMNNGVDMATYRRLAGEVLTEWQATSTPAHANLNDAQQHLVNQVRIKIEKQRQSKRSHETTQADRYARRRSFDPANLTAQDFEQF